MSEINFGFHLSNTESGKLLQMQLKMKSSVYKEFCVQRCDVMYFGRWHHRFGMSYIP
jgi:hypothetical protein